MIEKERIEQIKRSVDLGALMRSRGIELRKNGKGLKGRCPFHEDKDPSLSVNLKENLWQCFGCGAAGDVIRFVELFDKVGFPEAVEKLSENISSGADGPARAREAHPANGAPAPSARSVKLLTRVVDFYHTAFAEDGRAREYLATRGIAGNDLFSSYRIGFANGTLLNVLPEDGDVTRDLKEIGVLNDSGGEFFYGCATFPLFDANGNPAGLYGRRIDGMDTKGPDHLYLPGERRGLFNREAAKTSREIILCEAIIDSLTLLSARIHNTIPCYGTNGFTPEHLELFKQRGVKTLYIAFDAYESGRKAAGILASRLESEGFAARQVDLPEGEDVNSFFSLTADAKQKFMELVNEANPKDAVKEKREGQADGTAPEGPAPTEFGFTVSFTDRFYEVRGISRADNKLKATVKGISSGAGKKRFFVDTVDFYSARSRAFLIKGLCDLFGTEEKALVLDLERLMEHCEGWREKDPADSAPAEMSTSEKEAALAFLKTPDMFTRILSDFETLGYTGEEMNKLLCYLAAVSRKLDEPLSVMIQSRSAAGKSFLQDTVLSMVPEGECIKYTRLTDQALFYKDGKSLAHKILAVEELDGMNGAIYSIRAIQSSKKITIAYTGKDAVTGKLQTEENTVEGPLSVFITTTRTDIDGETASRFVFLSIDESREMTERILAKQRSN